MTTTSIFLLFGGISAIIFPTVTFCIDISKNKRWSAKNVITALAILFSAFAIIGGIIKNEEDTQNYENDKASQLSRFNALSIGNIFVTDIATQSKILTDTIKSSTDSILKWNESISIQQKTISKLNIDLISSLDNAINQVTGGDSYCYLRADYDMSGTPTFHLIHKGNFPIRASFRMKIHDRAKEAYLRSKITSTTNVYPEYLAAINNSHYEYNYSSMYPGESIIVDIPIEHPGQMDLDFDITIFLSNGTIKQHYQAKYYHNRMMRSDRNMILRGHDTLSISKYYLLNFKNAYFK